MEMHLVNVSSLRSLTGDILHLNPAVSVLIARCVKHEASHHIDKPANLIYIIMRAKRGFTF